MILILAAALAAIAILAASDSASAQDDPGCTASDLGQLSDKSAAGLQANGRWSTQDCESQFRPGSDAHNFEFEVVSGGRVRIELTSSTADPYLYLLATDGARIADNDDGGALLNARIERELAPGKYLVEATTVGGRARGAADFALSVNFVDGCRLIALGELTADADLTASGSWSLETCGSRIVVAHPAYNYLFQLPAPGRVRIGLTSSNGDPVLSLATVEGAVIGANDDGGVGRNALLEQFLPAGGYIIEATTYSRRGLQPLASDFELVVQLIDELQIQQLADPKVEAMAIPDQVISGDPFAVHYRVGNLGGGDLHEIAERVLLYVYGPGLRRWADSIPATESTWLAGTSYHTGDEVASAGSTAMEGLGPVEVTLDRAGRSWVLVALFVLDEEGRDIGFHSIWKNVTVLSAATFDPTRSRIDSRTFEVAASADSEGQVTTTVTDLADSQAEIELPDRIQATYSAGVRRLLLADIFERPTIAGLEELRAGSAPVAPAVDLGGLAPAGDSIMVKFGAEYRSAIAESGLVETTAARLMIDPVALEDLVLDNADSAMQQYAALAASWRGLRSRLGASGAITYAEALSLHSQLRYAESVLNAALGAGELVRAARAHEFGWDGGAVQAQVAEYAQGAACARPRGHLPRALSLSGDQEADALLALDAELRAVLPVFGTATDVALCAVAAIDAANDRLLELLRIDEFENIYLPGYQAAVSVNAPDPAPHQLRILTRLLADGRVEHAVELSGGQMILPTRRYLIADADVGRTYSSSPIEVKGSPIGVIRTRRDAGGLVEVSFRGSDGVEILPRIRLMPPNTSADVWLRSSQIEVPAAAPVLR